MKSNDRYVLVAENIVFRAYLHVDLRDNAHVWRAEIENKTKKFVSITRFL